MRLPIVCLDPRFRQFLSQFAGCFSQPQYKYFVTILLGLMLCQSGRTRSGLLGRVDSGVSLSGASRFMGQAEIIRTFVPVAGTLIHVLLDSWYTSRRIWKIARKCGILITSRLRCNHSLRIEDDQAERGWRWQRVDEYADTLPETA